MSSSRPDIPALLSTVFTRAGARNAKGRIETVPIACVPQARGLSLMGPNGQLLIENGEKDYSKGDQSANGRVSKADLFSSGVAAKITGVEGRGTGEFTLLVEGVARVKVDQIYQTQPYFEGKVIYHQDESKHAAFLELHSTALPLYHICSLQLSFPSDAGHSRCMILFFPSLALTIQSSSISR